MKAHLVESEIPLREGQTITANCGEEVHQARFVFLWDNAQFPEFLSVSLRQVCRKCAGSGLALHYIYGIVNAQELIDRNRELDEVAA